MSAPSGCGKTTIGNIISQEVPEITPSISHTTRKKRKGEISGKDYYFISDKKFRDMVVNKEFIEWEKVHTNLYGTSKEAMSQLSKESDVLFIIDYRGAVSIKKECQDNAVTIFLIPPSFEDLTSRIKKSKDSRIEELSIRLGTAREELKNACSFDYIVENNSLESAVEEIQTLIYAERLKRNRRTRKIQKMVNENKSET